jgi:hypothetical protein
MLTAGRVWAEVFVVGQRKTFYEGREFFLSDHLPVLGVVDCHDSFRESGRAARSIAQSRRGRVVSLRDIWSREEQVSSLEWLKRGREEKACERQQAAEEKRIAAWREQREVLLQRARRGQELLKAAFGSRSLWEQKLEDDSLPRLSQVRLNGWEEDALDVEVPTGVFLRGLVVGENDAVNACLLQVLLRLPVILSWLQMHAEHCANSRGCALCWLKVVRDAVARKVGQRNLHVRVLPASADRLDVQDMAAILTRLFDAWGKGEVAADRSGEVVIAAGQIESVTHVERLFGWIEQTRMRCEECGESCQQRKLCRSGILSLPVKISAGRACTVTELYLESCLTVVAERSCARCGGVRKHAVASRVATTPEVMILSFVRNEETLLAPVDVEEEVEFPGLSVMRLVAVVYRSRRGDGSALYSCACRGPMDAFWYFEEGRAPEAIKRSISHVKSKQVCMALYERVIKFGRRSQRRASGGTAKGSRVGQHGKRGTEKVDASSQAPRDEFQGVPGMWTAPRRNLKRYPSWVDSLQVQQMRQRRIECLVETEAFACVRAGGPGVGGDALLSGIEEALDDVIVDSDSIVFCTACSLWALQRLKDTLEDGDLRPLYEDAIAKLVGRCRDEEMSHPLLSEFLVQHCGEQQSAGADATVEAGASLEDAAGSAVDGDLLLEYGIVVTDVFREFQRGGEDVGSLPKLKAALQLEARALDRKRQKDKSFEVRLAVLRECAAKHEQLRTYSSLRAAEASFFAMVGETLREENASIEREQQHSSAAVDADMTGTGSSGFPGTGGSALDIVDLVEEDTDGGAGVGEEDLEGGVGDVEADVGNSGSVRQAGRQQSDTVDAVIAEGRGSKRVRAPVVSSDAPPARRSARVAARLSRADGPANPEVQVPSKRRRR